jgi:transposase-like protein
VPKRHPPELRAQAIAAVASGEQPAAVAKRLGISQGLLHGWWKQHADDVGLSEVSRNPGAHVREREHTELIDLVEQLVIESVKALSAQARVAGRDAWIERQSARGLADYRGVEFDRIIRLLAAFRPVDDEPSDDAIDGTAVDVP